MKFYISLLMFFTVFFAQHDFFNIKHNDPYKLSFMNSMISERFQTANYYSTSIVLSYDWFPWLVQFKSNFNNFMDINLDNTFYSLPDNIPANYLQNNKIRSNNYFQHFPFEFLAAYEYDLFSFYIKSTFVSEIFTHNRVTDFISDEFPSRVVYDKKEFERYSLDNSVFLTYKNNSNVFGIGLKNFLIELSSNDLLYSYEPSTYVYLSYEIEEEAFFFISLYENGLSYKLNISEDIDITPSMFYYSGDFERVNVNFKYDYKLNSQFILFTNFEFNKGTQNSIFLKDFKTFVKSTRPDKYNQNSIVSVGVDYSFTDGRKQYTPKLISLDLKEKELYTYNKDLYHSDAFATLRLENSSSSNIYYKILLRSEKEYIHYKSDDYIHYTGEDIKIPLFVNLDKELGPTDQIQDKIFISILRDGREELLFEEDITINGSNFWDGKISGLKVFIKPNDVFLNRKIIEQSRKDYPSKFEKLKHLINFYGHDFEVVETKSKARQNKIQSPFMTFTQKKGTKNELIIFFSYLFRKAGFENRILTINEENKDDSKVLLVINTDLKKDDMKVNALDESNSVYLNNRLGFSTVWIPFDPSHINLGFETLLELSSQHYNTKVKNSQGSEFKIYPID